MKANIMQALTEHMAQFVTPHKHELIEKIMGDRTRHLTLVLENLFQPHNASAVVRSAECFGVQDIHIIEKNNEFQLNRDIVIGSSKWIHTRFYRKETGTADCIKKLKGDGYKIVATTLRPGSKPIQELDLSQKVALCFGTEETGLSEEMHEAADELVYIPMHGFTQSLNISVSAAIALFSITERLHASDIDWHLTTEEQQKLRLEWFIKSASKGKAIVKEFLKNLPLSSRT